MLCKICNKDVKSIGTHLIKNHSDVIKNEYYDTYLRTEQEEGFCLECSKPTMFLGLTKGYRLYCSNSCAQKSSITRSKIKNTYKDRTGYEHNSLNPESQKRMQETNRKNNGGVLFFQNKDAIQKIKKAKIEKFGSVNNFEKIKKTNIEKYGVENQYQRHDIIEKCKKTKIEKFGSANNFEKIKKTNIEKYGVESPLSLKSVHDDLSKLLKERKLQKYNEMLLSQNSKMIKYDNRLCLCKCLNCNLEYKIQPQLIRKRIHFCKAVCINCNPLVSINETSKGEKEILEFISSIIPAEANNRNILLNKELDIYIPTKKIAVEFNGLYWHSDQYKSFDYHLNKTEECEKLGVHLIHIYEDDWLYKQNIVKSRLKSILGLSEQKLFARKCVIKELTNVEASMFLEENHLQGGGPNSKYRYGLFFENELVAVMTFGASRFEKNKIELHRFANKLGSNVTGGASRLFKHFLNIVKPTEVISYADRSWTMNNGKSVYEQLGFKNISIIRPNYYYIKNGIRENRFKFRKSELVKEGFDPKQTESEIMIIKGYDKIYDSGNLKFIYKN